MKNEFVLQKRRFRFIRLCLTILVTLSISGIVSCGTSEKPPVSTNAEESSTTMAQATTVTFGAQTDQESTTSQSETTAEDAAGDLENIKSRFELLREGELDHTKIFAFIDENIEFVDIEFADEMIDFAIQFSESELYPFGDKYANTQIQEKLWNDFNGSTDLNILKNAEDEEIARLARETLDRKYKLDSTEGYISPIIDYEAYKSYGAYIADKMNAFIDIMALESESPSLKDAAVIIPLDEFVERILMLYDFEEKYPGFVRIYYIVNMLNGKLWVYMGGIDNTPVFKFSSSNIIQERLDDFREKAEKYKGTRFADKLSEYLELLEAENYMRTQKVSDYIENLTFY